MVGPTQIGTGGRLSSAPSRAAARATIGAVDEKRNLFGLSRKELESCAAELGLPAFRGRQLYRWIYSKSATDLDS